MHAFPWFKIGSLLVAAQLAGLALAAEPLTTTLAVHRIAVLPDGRETAQPAASAKPGELLEYVAEFHNNGLSTARAVSATLPLPAGTEFVAASPRPAGALASLDGVTFAAIPLKRRVQQPDGVHEVLVPFSEYRYLRWPATELAVGASLSVSARVAISPTTIR